MGLRKNQNRLTDAEKARFVAAVKKMKADTAAPHNYNKYVTLHLAAFSGNPDTNPAHMGPAFFPWHRYFLSKFEKDVEAADRALGGDGNVTLPYWDWTHDNGDGPDHQRGSLWKDSLLGGYGNPVTAGPFRSGQWAIVPTGGPLIRALGRGSIDADSGAFGPSLPEREHVDRALALEGFDCSPYDTSSPAGPALASPGAPTVSGTGGGTLAPGSYRVVTTYLNARGETRSSPESVVCLGAACSPANANTAVRVQSPPARPSATHYKVYVTAAGGASLSETQQGAPVPISTPATITNVAPGAPLPTINTTGSFRNVLEGWISDRGAAAEIHNRVHVWVGGSMGPGTSPNDPVFFLHHCNIDRLWALWQFRHPGQNYPLTVPMIGGPGNRPHGLNDPMPPWTAPPEVKRPIDVLNHTSLGYTYDTDPVGVALDLAP